MTDFPLCPLCRDSLVPAPSSFPSSVPFPISAAYLLAGPGYEVLKTWKKRRGPLFTRIVLGALPRIQTDAIVPIPQRLERSWILGGSPALEIAEALSRISGAPVIHALLPVPRLRKRQAELSLRERLASGIRFELALQATSAQNARVLLVDDFMTTGRTMAAAGAALQRIGITELRGFCLGVRLRFRSENQLETPASGDASLESAGTA